MTLPTDAILLVLLAALCHACWNAVIKIGGDRVVVLAVVNLVGAVLSLLALPFVEIPAPQAWPWLLGSVAVHVLYYYWAMSRGPMAQVSAIRETSVIFATLIGVYMLKESFGIRRVIASILVACGLILLNTS